MEKPQTDQAVAVVPGWEPEEIESYLRELYTRAATDKKFRELCMKDGRAALQKISGIELPSEVRVDFVERLEKTVLVLPPYLGELQEQQGKYGFTVFAGCSGFNTLKPCYH